MRKKRLWSGFMAVLMAVSGMGACLPFPARASDIWPQKSTAPFYCIDGGKSWRQTDRYDNYKYDTLPSPLTVTQTKRLFWAYPTNWNALKEAAAKYDPELYREISSAVSGPNVVKRVKDNAGTRFAWVADNPEIEERAIAVMEQASAEGQTGGKEAPEAIREATSEEKAVSFTVLPFSDGPGALDTEFVLGSEFIRDIASIEPQSVWDNGSTGGNVGWLDASQDKNIAKSAMGESLYELTWSGDSIKIHNNGSAVANENAVGSTMSEEEKYNKTTVRYKITMRSDSGWYTEGSWNEDYLHEWMDFKACINAPGHQRLYKADIRIVPSDMVFYLVIGQEAGEAVDMPEYGGGTPELDFQIYRHEETFESNYNVRLRKYDDETGMPLKGSQFYLYERFEDAEALSDSPDNAGLTEENLSFSPWEGFQIFAEGITDENGEITHRDTRTYHYSKTYCDGHGAPKWADVPEAAENGEDGASDSDGAGGSDGAGDESESSSMSGAEETRDRNRAAARQWMEWVEECAQEAEESGTHFHWLADESAMDEVLAVLADGEAAGSGGGDGAGADSGDAFSASGCQEDCEETYRKFTELRFTYTWKEIQARTGYILHDLHAEDTPIELVTTVSSEAGARAGLADGSSRDITDQVWYAGGDGSLRTDQTENSPDAETSAASALGNILEALAAAADRRSGVKRDPVSSYTARIFSAEKGPGGGRPAATATGSDAEEMRATAADARKASRMTATGSDAADAGSEGMGEEISLSAAPALLPAARYSAGDEDGEEADDSVETDDSEWEEAGGSGDFMSYLEQAAPDGIVHREKGNADRFSHCSGAEDCQDSWRVYDHRTEGRLHINKRDLDLYRKESESYSSFGDTEGDGTLAGAVYGLFAAEDIVHPDSELAADGTLRNTGIVYHQNDLVSMASTDADGNADFLAYTVEPGMIYNYGTGQLERRDGAAGTGPVNLYTENQENNGNYWIGRPLILGKYYVKELSRSEGYELSVNGMTGEWTNQGTGLETPPSIALSHGTAVLSFPELSASMDGGDGSGMGYDRLSFSVVSSGTTDETAGTDGYEILLSGFPEGTRLYRVDTGEEEVTGPHVTGTEEAVVRDENGNPVWKRAESSRSHVRYQPEYGSDGSITGQTPMSREEPQIVKAEQIPGVAHMKLENLEMDLQEPMLYEKISGYAIESETDEAFRFVKAEVEAILSRNGYDVPTTAEGLCSLREAPVYSRGVRKGQPDLYAMTTAAGEPALKTVYGAAVAELLISDPDPNMTVYDLILSILAWYQEHSQWNFGGIDSIVREQNGWRLTLYAGMSAGGSRRFFTMTEENGKLQPDCVYAVLENPAALRWVYQPYEESGAYRYVTERQYSYGSGSNRRYYIDALLTPAVLVTPEGMLQDIYHTVMVYHEQGEEVVDYLSGDPENGYRVPLTETVDRIEITTEPELVEKDVLLEAASYDRKTETYRIHVKTEGTDSFGREFSDAAASLQLQFMAELPRGTVRLTGEELEASGAGAIYGYRAGDEIGYAEYLLRVCGASATVSAVSGGEAADTYIVVKPLVYRGQERVFEDGDTGAYPLQVLERPVKQKIRVVKNVDDGEAIGNFRFKIYLKSNLERLFRNEEGEIFWTDRNGEPVEIHAYRDAYPELVQKVYTKETGIPLLETYDKFFDAVRTADTDRWHLHGEILNSSFKPFADGRFTGIRNRINSSDAAKENAKRSDAVRQFAVTWYLADEIEALTREIPGREELEAGSGQVSYPDEIYDQALYQAILKAEDYLKPFFLYDLDSIYEILWDSEENGGIDQDLSTLSAAELEKEGGKVKYAFGISEYLPYGDYVLVEQQPFYAQWMDFENRHYAIDAPKEISLPSVYEEASGEEDGLSKEYAEKYCYRKEDTPAELAEKYYLRFNEEWAENQTEGVRRYVIRAHNEDGDFEIYPYGLDRERAEGHYEPYGNPAVAAYYHYGSVSENASVKESVHAMTGIRTAFDGSYASMLVPWSVTDPEEDGASALYSGYADQTFLNRRYRIRLRVEKLDEETGEPILHDDAVFGVYQAERNEAADGDGAVRRYDRDTLVTGTRLFLEAMGAESIAPFARNGFSEGPGVLCYGIVPAGTPICKENSCVGFTDGRGVRTGEFYGLSTVYDAGDGGVFQTAGYFETPEPLEAGVYVLAELKAPAGYVRSAPVAVEIYSDAVSYYPDGKEQKAAAVLYPSGDDEAGSEENVDTARIYVKDLATSLEVSKVKTMDAYRGMKVSGRIEGSILALYAEYGQENVELAFNSQGVYQGFGWKRGTLEYLESRKEAGERMELVYENGVFQGYGYVTRNLETAAGEDPYVPGAEMVLYEAIEVQPTNDTEDHGFEGLEIVRDRNGHVSEIYVKEGYAGEKTEFIRRGDGAENAFAGTGDGTWDVETVQRKDTPVLFYDLGGLQVTEQASDGTVYGYDRSGKRQKITFDTDSIYALRMGLPVFEISGGDLTALVYDKGAKAFTDMSAETDIYHLDSDLCRDAMVDGYTGLAFVEKTETGNSGREERRIYVWPVTVHRGPNGTVLSRDKILTGRPAEINAGEENAYITGAWSEETKTFEKTMSPAYDKFGLVRFYQRSGRYYTKGGAVYDRDGDYVYYRYDDLLGNYNRAAYMLLDHKTLYWTDGEAGENAPEHRRGEAYWIPNRWITGEAGSQPDLLRRVIPGAYIMEEVSAPAGYSRALPTAVRVVETDKIQRTAMTNEKIKIEISKVDGTDEAKALIPGARLALFRADRVYCSDYGTYPRGYYLVKAEDTPVCWEIPGNENEPAVQVTAQWTTTETARYFEGIPAGDYILEELDAPDGYLAGSMEIQVKAVPDLQSFVFKNDYTKMEIFKYETADGSRRIPLAWPKEAELTLYPAITDEEGNVRMNGGVPLFQAGSPVDVWNTDDLSGYVPDMTEEYERLFEEYGERLSEFTWQAGRGGKQEEKHAVLVENHVTAGAEKLHQLWETEDGMVRITVCRNGRSQGTGEDGKPENTYDYRFHYKTGSLFPEMESYDTAAGLHRIDRIPAGVYVLVETRTPEGYQTAEPTVITVSETADLRSFAVENLRLPESDAPAGIVSLEKQEAGHPGRKLSGAWFEVRNVETGQSWLMETDEAGKARSTELPVGRLCEDGTIDRYHYQVRELWPPDGYCVNSFVWSFQFDEAEASRAEPLIYEIVAENEETEFQFSKTSFRTDGPVAGAALSVYRAQMVQGVYEPQGEALDSWISGDKVHRIHGKLSAGGVYLLVEEAAPQGHAAAEPVVFTISSDGRSISELSAPSGRLRMLRAEGETRLQAISIDGRYPFHMQYSLARPEEEPVFWLGTGEDRWIEAEEGELLVLCGQVVFSDGSTVPIRRESFRAHPDETGVCWISENIPVKAELRLLDQAGNQEAVWEMSENSGAYLLENRRKEDGAWLLEAGSRYILEERVLFEDGSMVRTGRTELVVDEEGGMVQVDLKNKETEVWISKRDITAGEELPGAKLTILDQEGNLIDQWISEEEPHIIRGTLQPGETYTLREELAPEGYGEAEEITFTVSPDGAVDRVIMEDEKERAETPEAPEEPEKPSEPEAPQEPDGPEEPEKPEEPETPEEPEGPETPESPEELEVPQESEEPEKSRRPGPVLADWPEAEKQTGIITAKYERKLSGEGGISIRQPEALRVSVPGTGDEEIPEIYVSGMILSAAGLIWLWRKRRKGSGS